MTKLWKWTSSKAWFKSPINNPWAEWNAEFNLAVTDHWEKTADNSITIFNIRHSSKGLSGLLMNSRAEELKRLLDKIYLSVLIIDDLFFLHQSCGWIPRPKSTRDTKSRPFAW